jgi:hypothetical protein
MTTITLKINERTKVGKSFMAFIKAFSEKEKEIEIVPESVYNPDFVKMIKDSAASKKRYEVKNIDELWQSL